MAQNALTVTAANPTPPTNLIYVGNTPPLDPAQVSVDDGISAAVPNSRLLTPVNTSTINEDSTITTWPTAITFAASTAAANSGAGVPGAGISNTHEARGTETVTTTGAGTPGSANPVPGLGQLKMVGVGPALTAASIAAGPNAAHASSLTPITPVAPTTSAASGASNVSGVGTTLLTVTGTNFNRTSTVNLNGIRQTTNYVSPTSLTVTNALKRTTAGTLPVTVTNDSTGLTSTPGNQLDPVMSKKTADDRDTVEDPPREVNKHGVPVADGPPDQAPADNSSQGRYHGYTDAQVARIEAEKDQRLPQPSAESEAVQPGTEEQLNDPSGAPVVDDEAARARAEEEAQHDRNKHK